MGTSSLWRPQLELTISLLQWVVKNGVEGLLLGLCLVEGWIILRLYKEVQRVQSLRINDMKAFIDVSNRLHHEVQRTAQDMATIARVRREPYDNDS